LNAKTGKIGLVVLVTVTPWDSFTPNEHYKTAKGRPKGRGGESQVCCHSATQSPQFELFDVSFPEKLLKIVAARGEIFSQIFTKYRSAAGLRPDSL